MIFRILDNGDIYPKTQQAIDNKELVSAISEKALRYDLTIPFARFVAMNHGQLTFPFKRYQVQPVWRGDRPQRGRYREFFQCDADVVGSNSLLNEVELTHIYDDAFSRLNIPGIEIHINSRKILTALAEVAGCLDKMTNITIAIDKLDKIGLEKVKEELNGRGLNSGQIDIIEKYLSITGSNDEILKQAEELLGSSGNAIDGINELRTIINFSENGFKNKVVADLTLARGLDYYTGAIFEVKTTAVKMGSIGGGGRYDNLTGTFGVSGIPGVGISFGVDRIYDVMEELNIFPDSLQVSSKVLFFNLGDAEIKAAFHLLHDLRNKNISGEIYHEQAKMDKQFKYAEKKNIPFVVILGSRELEEKNVVLKNIKTGKQETITWESLLSFDFFEKS